MGLAAKTGGSMTKHITRLERLERRRVQQTVASAWICYKGDTEAIGPGGERRPVDALPPGARLIVIAYEDVQVT